MRDVEGMGRKGRQVVVESTRRWWGRYEYEGIKGRGLFALSCRLPSSEGRYLGFVNAVSGSSARLQVERSREEQRQEELIRQ